MPMVLGESKAFAVDDGGPYAIKAWNFETEQWELISTDGRVLVVENRRVFRDFVGHLTGRGSYGSRKIGYLATQNMELVPHEPSFGDLWMSEWYRRYAGDDSPTERRASGQGGVLYLARS